MNSLIYLFRFIYRIRWWLLIGPALAALFVIYKTQKMSHTYQTRTTIYTGAVSGYTTQIRAGPPRKPCAS